MSLTPNRESDGSPHTDRYKSSTPNKERDGVHVKELGRDFLNLFKRKKKKDAFHPPAYSPPPPPPMPSSEPTQKEEHSDPVSISHLPGTSPVHSEVTQHSADTRSAIHVVTSATSTTEMTSTGATSGESVDHDHSIEDNKKKFVREERRAYYRSKGIHVVADEDDTTDLEESHCPFRVDRRLIDRLQWKDGVTPVEFGKLRRPRFVKRREDKDGEKLKHPMVHPLEDAIPLKISLKRKKKADSKGSKEELREGSMERLKEAATPIDEKTPRKRSPRNSREEMKKDDDGLSAKEGRLKDAIPLIEKASRKRSKEELKDAIPLEEKKKCKEEKKKDEPMSRRNKRSKKKGSEEEGAVEVDSEQEKRRRRKGDEGMKDALPMEDRSMGRKKKSDGDGKKEEKGKEEKKEEKKKEEKGGDEGKKKEAKGGEKDEEKKERGKEKEKGKEWKKKEDDDGEMRGERELREARRKEEEKIGDKDKEGPKSDDRLAVVPYEKWPVPAIVETIDGYTGYRVLTAGYKTAYFGYVCMHVSYSFVAHLFSFDFNRSVPPSISTKLLTPSPKSKEDKSDKRDDGKSPCPSTPRSTTPRSTRRIVIKTPVEYSNLSVPSSDSVDVAICH